MTTNQKAIRELFRVEKDFTGNLPSYLALSGQSSARRSQRRCLARIDADALGHAVASAIRRAANINIRNTRPRTGGAGSSRTAAAWCRSPVFRNTTTNRIRNRERTMTAHHIRWLGKDVVWFALDEDRPVAALASIYAPWSGTRGTRKNPVEGNHTVYGFLTTEPNAVVAPVHAKAMSVIQTNPCL